MANNNNGSIQTIPITNPTFPHEQQTPLLQNSSFNFNTHSSASNISDDEYFKSLPPGFRFIPQDHELILHYLLKKVYNEPLHRSKVVDANLYESHPQELIDKLKKGGEQEWYFFTPREKKYKRGSRPNRMAGDGYWKATGADKSIKYEGQVIGCKKSLVYYDRKSPNGEKTTWIMHEYRLKDPPAPAQPDNEMRLDDWVLCRVHNKREKSNANDAIPNEDVEVEEALAIPNLSTSSSDQYQPSDQEIIPGLNNESPTMMNAISAPQFNTGIHQIAPSMSYNDVVYPTPLTVVPPMIDPTVRIHGDPANHHHHTMMGNDVGSFHQYSSSTYMPMHGPVSVGPEPRHQEEGFASQVSRLDVDQFSHTLQKYMDHVEMGGIDFIHEPHHGYFSM